MPHCQGPRADRGISLMESVVVIGIMTMVLLVVNQIFVVNYDLILKETGRTDNDTGAVMAIRRISEITRGASTVLASATINGTLYATSAEVLVVELPALDSNGNILPGNFDRIAVARNQLTPTQILTDTLPAAGSSRAPGKKLLTAYNQTMYFRYNDPDASKATRVSVYIVNKQTIRGARPTTRAWTSIFLRNR